MHVRPWIIVASLFAFPLLARAELRFTQPTVSLGKLRGGPAYSHCFEFVNAAATALEIIDVRLGCGCLQPVLDKRIYQPGEKGAVIMHVRTLGQQAGTRTWQARVLYRQSEAVHETTLILAATLRNEVTVEPSILAMSVETTVRQEVTIVDHRATPMKITAVVASAPAIRVNTRTQGNGVTTVMLEVTRAALTAARQEEMLTIHTDDPHYRILQVPITLTKANGQRVTVTPERVELRGAGSKLVRLRAAGDQPVRIERVDADHPALKCTWAAGPDNDATLKISVAGLQPTTITATTVRVRLAQPAATLTIPITLHME